MYKQTPRKAYYLLAHEAFRLMAENDPEQFFQLMASEHQADVINQLIDKVNSLCEQEPCDFSADAIEVKLSLINALPTILITLPAPKAYVECFYVAIVGLFAAKEAKSSIGYFTLELAESEPHLETDSQAKAKAKTETKTQSNSGEQKSCASFCQWQGDTHYSLAELDLGCSLETFELLLGQRLSE